VSNVPANGISSPWIKEYVSPDREVQSPGPGGMSANPMGNCTRCGDVIHHEVQAEHHITKHLTTGPISHAALDSYGAVPSRNEVGFRAPGKHAKR